jgi:hypothetical protein
MVHVVMNLFVFILFELCCALLMCKLMSFLKFNEEVAIIYSNISFSLSSFVLLALPKHQG